MKAKFSLIALLENGSCVTVKDGKKPPTATRFYVRYSDEQGRHEESLGPDFRLAQKQIETREATRIYEKSTGTKLPPREPDEPLAPDKKTIREAVKAFLAKKSITPDIAENTVENYSQATGHFLRFMADESNPHKCQFLTDIEQDDMFRFSAFLKKEGYKRSSVYSYFLTTMIFLKASGIRLGIPSKQWGKPPKRPAQAYTPEQLDAFFEAALRLPTDSRSTFTGPELVLIFKSFLYTGMRNQELAHLVYGNIDFKHSLWSVRTLEDEQDYADWEPKSKDGVREIPVPDFHTRAIRERMLQRKAKDTDLVFPNTEGKPCKTFRRLLKRVAKLAGITGRVDIHKFRSTCATIWLRKPEPIDVWELRRRIGHSDLETLESYVQLANLQEKEVIVGTNQKFAHWAPKPELVRAAGD